MVRDYLVIAAEYRQAVVELREAQQSLEQAEETVNVMRGRVWSADARVNTLNGELRKAAV